MTLDRIHILSVGWLNNAWKNQNHIFYLLHTGGPATHVIADHWCRWWCAPPHACIMINSTKLAWVQRFLHALQILGRWVEQLTHIDHCLQTCSHGSGTVYCVSGSRDAGSWVRLWWGCRRMVGRAETIFSFDCIIEYLCWTSTLSKRWVQNMTENSYRGIPESVTRFLCAWLWLCQTVSMI